MKNTFIVPHLMKFGQLQGWPNAAIPTLAQVNDFIPWLCRTPCDYLLRDDPESMAECSLLTHEFLGLDSLFLNLDAYNFEAESMGAVMRFYPDHMPDLDRSQYLIKDERDFDKIRWNGLESGRFPYLLRYAKAYREYTGLPAELYFCAPWSLAGNLYGLDNLIMAALTEPEFTDELLNRIVEDLHAPMFSDLKKEFPEMNMLRLVDAFASPPMVTTDILREYIEPALKKELASPCLEGMTLYNVGIWGASKVPENQRDYFVDFTIRCAAQQLLAFDPDLTDLGASYFRKHADETGAMLVFGMSTNTLQNESPEKIAGIIKANTLTGKKGKTPLIMGFNNIAPGTPVENIQAALAAVDVYGRPEADETTPFALPEKKDFSEFLKQKKQNNPEGYAWRWLKQSGFRDLLS